MNATEKYISRTIEDLIGAHPNYTGCEVIVGEYTAVISIYHNIESSGNGDELSNESPYLPLLSKSNEVVDYIKNNILSTKWIQLKINEYITSSTGLLCTLYYEATKSFTYVFVKNNDLL